MGNNKKKLNNKSLLSFVIGAIIMALTIVIGCIWIIFVIHNILIKFIAAFVGLFYLYLILLILVKLKSIFKK